jgi:hypothetical protein
MLAGRTILSYIRCKGGVAKYADRLIFKLPGALLPSTGYKAYC